MTEAPLDAPLAAAVAVASPTLASRLASFDTTVDRWFEQVRGNHAVDRLFYGASAVGDFSLIWQIAGAAEGLRGRERKAVVLALSLGVESVLINGVVKSFFRRERPAWDQHRPRTLRKPRSSSFPSGHATSAFMAATVLGTGRSTPAKVGWYGAASVLAASRVHVRIHHASDVVGGVAIGLGLGALVRRLVR
jgi:undecaprenyl-diphosphatase